ncbi:MAG: aspartate-semialdehyde dehydrogenase [Candidatus Methanofastidiosia archaeon]
MKVGILGVTGCVGQRFVQMLENHPNFEVLQLFGKKSRGKKYRDMKWILEGEVPEYVGDFEIENISEISSNVEMVFSALPSKVAEKLEVELAKMGKIVASNASAHRMKEDVPLIVPEINPEHLNLLSVQKKIRKWEGAILTNPNCSTTILSLALKPILDNFGIEKITAVTMQAVSGAGYPGLPSLDILGNVIPYIKGEEEKIVEETEKIFGKKFEILVSCNRVPTIDGHLVNVFVKTGINFEVEDVLKIFENFSGLPQKRKLPTAPQKPILVRREEDRPQTRLDLNPMAVVVGRVRKIMDTLAFTVLGHNTIRGAAGASILNAELLEVGEWMEKN